MVNPVVLIATHERVNITMRNIHSLAAQSIRPKICLSVTDYDEGDQFRICAHLNKYDLTIGYSINKPLGLKWQSGVDFCHDANPLIITGSDDILGPGFIERACQLVEEGNHFIGLQRFWQHHKGRGYLCDYLPHQPIGGGRIYSGEMLKKINYQVFDPKADKHLDDYGWNKVRSSGLKVKWVRNIEEENLHIHAIKGDWPVMNPFNLEHKNIRPLRSELSYRLLPDIFSYPSLLPHDDLA